MIERREAIVLAGALLAIAGAALRIARAGSEPVTAASTTFVTTAGAIDVGDDSLGEAAANTAANDPFRLVNRPSGVRYDAKTEGGVGVPAAFVPPPVRPAFVLKAIVGGPPWQAVVDGIPGQQPGTIVRSGTTFDKLTVRSVGRDTVVIQAPDTIWKLTLSRGRL
ncbi:MAG TPA: hypothetical protein VFS59_11930 [Gemmatimonadaceae bacterium]|nr:hypothetical protein [Gemmatimonadaceae bacterium]